MVIEKVEVEECAEEDEDDGGPDAPWASDGGGLKGRDVGVDHIGCIVTEDEGGGEVKRKTQSAKGETRKRSGGGRGAGLSIVARESWFVGRDYSAKASRKVA